MHVFGVESSHVYEHMKHIWKVIEEITRVPSRRELNLGATKGKSALPFTLSTISIYYLFRNNSYPQKVFRNSPGYTLTYILMLMLKSCGEPLS